MEPQPSLLHVLFAIYYHCYFVAGSGLEQKALLIQVPKYWLAGLHHHTQISDGFSYLMLVFLILVVMVLGIERRTSPTEDMSLTPKLHPGTKLFLF